MSVPAPELSPRFTAWLPEERKLLREFAREQGSSENYVLRCGLRLLLGLSVPPWARAAAANRHELADSDRELVLGGERAVS